MKSQILNAEDRAALQQARRASMERMPWRYALPLVEARQILHFAYAARAEIALP